MAFIAISVQIFWQKFYRNVPWLVLYQPYEFCPNRWIWLVAMATETLNLRKNIQESSPQKPLGGWSWSRNVHSISRYKNYVFIAVAHVLSSLWQLIVSIDFYNGKVGLYFYSTADILTKVFQKCSLSSPLPNIWILSKPLNLIGCHGNRKDKFTKKILKNHILRSHKVHEAETLQKCS